MRGAIHRATEAFQDCTYSFGLESGLLHLPNPELTYLDICVCAIYDGEKIALGMSQGFPLPPEAKRLVLDEGKDLNQTFHTMGLTDEEHVGSGKGVISILTKGRVTRKEQIQQAIMMALIPLEHKELY